MPHSIPLGIIGFSTYPPSRHVGLRATARTRHTVCLTAGNVAPPSTSHEGEHSRAPQSLLLPKMRFASNAGHQRRSRDVQTLQSRRLCRSETHILSRSESEPMQKYPKQVLQRIEWWFWDWFAYDCAVSGIGLTGNESEDFTYRIAVRSGRRYLAIPSLGRIHV